MSDERTVLEAVARAAQACFQQHPVVILGSGASVPHKIRGMGELATFLLENVTASEGQEADAWLLIRTALVNPGLFTEPRSAGGDWRFQGPGRPLPKVLSRIW